MANILNRNPIIIDTEGETSRIMYNYIKIQNILWVGVLAGNNVVIRDSANTHTILDFTSTDAQDKIELIRDWFAKDGIYISTLDGGKLYIYYE